MAKDLPQASKWLGLPAIAAVVAVLAALRLLVAARAGLSLDESYYTFWSERLAVGYLDHPPAVAWLIAAGRALLGDNELGVRLFAVVCGLGVSAAIWRIGVLIADRTIAALAVLLYNFTPAAGLGFIITPDPPSALFWAATIWAVAEFMASQRAGWWLVAGGLAGLGLWSKYTDAFLAPGLVLFVIASRARWRWLGLWQMWAAPVIALIVFAPVIWWNAQHGWASFAFQGQRTVSEGIDPQFLGNFIELIEGQALFAGPVLLALGLAGLLMPVATRDPARRAGLALPALTTLPALGYFAFHTLHARVEANWLIPLWPPLSPLAAALLVALARRARWLAIGLVGVQALVGLGLSAFVYVQTLGQPLNLGGGDRTSETRGWPDTERQVMAIASTNGARWIATRGNFQLTGELASYALFAKFPLPVRQVDEPIRWVYLPPPPPDQFGWPALFVGRDATPPTDIFGTAKPAGTVDRTDRFGTIERYWLFVVDSPTPKFAAGITGVGR